MEQKWKRITLKDLSFAISAAQKNTQQKRHLYMAALLSLTYSAE